MSSNFSTIRPRPAELAALELLKLDVFCCQHSSNFIFHRGFFIFAGNRKIIKSRIRLKFGQIQQWTTELAALVGLKKHTD